MARTEIGEIFYRITGDNTGLKRSLGESDQHSKNFMGTIANVGKAIAGAFVVKQIFDVGKAIIGVASDASETSSKFGVVFSSISERANQTAADISAGYGLSRNAAKEYLSGVGDILKGLNFTQSASLETSASIVKLSADLVSFKNYSGGVEGATRAITSALLGERESLKGLGIAISENDLEDFAAQSGLVWKNLDKQHQSTLALALITERAGNAVGDFERTQYGFANQVRVAEGNINNLEVTLGTKLLPAATLGVIAFNSIIKAVDKSAMSFGDWITSAEGSQATAEFLARSLSTIMGIFSSVEPIISVLGDGFGVIWDALSTGLGDVTDTNNAFIAFSGIAVGLSGILKILATTLTGGITLIIDLGNAFWEVAKVAAYFFGVLSGQITWSQLKEQVGNAGFALKKLGDDVINATEKITGEVGKLWNNYSKDVDKNTKTVTATTEKYYKTIKDGTEKALKATQEADKKEVQSTASSEQEKTQIILTEQQKRFDHDRNGRLDAAEQRDADTAQVVEQLQKIQSIASRTVSGISELFSAINDTMQNELKMAYDLIDQQTNASIAALDADLAKTLETAGLKEKTQKEKLQAQLDDAIAKGDEETAARLQDEIDRSDITDKYNTKKTEIEKKAAKEKALMEYAVAKRQWEMQKLMAVANMATGILQATIAGIQMGFPAMIAAIPIFVGIAAAAGVANIVAIEGAKPVPPALGFEKGGIVPGSSFTGDRIPAKVNSKEMILTEEQQANLFNLANSGGMSGGNSFSFYFDLEPLYERFYVDSKNGKYKIHKRGVVAL